MRAILDTNVLVYNFIEDSEFHEEVNKKLEKIETKVVPVNVLIEFVLICKKIGVKDEDLKKKMLEILDVCLIEQLFEEDIRYAISISKNLREINDGLLISICKRLDAPLFTYDKGLQRRAEEFGIRLI